MQGGPGNDQLFGYEGRDWLRAGPGNDAVDGGPNVDDQHGGNGRDNIEVTTGDSVRGGAGLDLCRVTGEPALLISCGRNVREVPPSDQLEADARTLLANLTVVNGFTPGVAYDRDDYDGDGWGDEDGDCVNTRHEVLIRDSSSPVVRSGCSVVSGRWVDPYDGAVYSLASAVQVDHFVPLAHAHRAGAWAWDEATKRAFSNDLDDPAALQITRGELNQSKADRGPDEWRPPDQNAWCGYAIDWIGGKTRWKFQVRPAEVTWLNRMLATCDGTYRRTGYPPADATIVQAPDEPPPPPPPPPPSDGVVITRCDRSDEYVDIVNDSATAVSLNGWQLRDDGIHFFVMSRTLQPGGTVRVISGLSPVAGPGEVIGWSNHIWNNDGDTAFLFDSGGAERSRLRCTS